LWRAQGRRVRLELKHFQRQVMTHTMLHPDEVEGWPGEIREGKVVSGARQVGTDNEKAASRPRQRRATADRTRTADRDKSGRRRSPARQRSRT
jgi:hypothetical protein